MATTFRAIVMLIVLVGLPSAWIYYGPLPPSAMGVVERTVASARQSLGWEKSDSVTQQSEVSLKTAPRFDSPAKNVVADNALAEATQVLQQQTAREFAVESNALPLSATSLPTTQPTPTRQDSQFLLASATQPVAQSALQLEPLTPTPLHVDDDLAARLNPHLSVLRAQGAADYTLEKWGNKGLYRFRCSIALGTSDNHTQQFEAIHADPLLAVQQVVGEVTGRQNARLHNTQTRWR